MALDFSNSRIKQRYQLVQGVNLRIQKAHESDTGTYTCRICSSDRDESTYQNSNSEATSSSTAELALSDECDERSALVKVLVSPRFLKQPANLNVTLKTDAELECSAYGIPTPTIQWFKNGEPIYPSEYFQFSPNQGNLKILGIIGQDEGYYQCLASNELNTIQSVAKLTVQPTTEGDGGGGELSDEHATTLNLAGEDENEQSRLKKAQSNSEVVTSTLLAKLARPFNFISTLVN